MSAAEADPVIAATAVSASANFFIFNPSVEASDRLWVREHRFPKPSVRTIRSSIENAVAAEAHPAANRVGALADPRQSDRGCPPGTIAKATPVAVDRIQCGVSQARAELTGLPS